MTWEIGSNAIILEPIWYNNSSRITFSRVVWTTPWYRTKYNNKKYKVFYNKSLFIKYTSNRLCFCLRWIDVNKL